LSGGARELALREVDCALCGGSRRRLEFRDGPYSVVTCADCDLTYVTPRPSDDELIARVYDEGYWRSQAARDRGYTDYRADEPFYLATYERRARAIEAAMPAKGRVLDVGCAAGYFLRVMRERGWDVAGIEPSDTIRATAQAALGAERVRGGTLGAAGYATESFDLITVWDVLEHVPDPVALLRECARLLRRDGRLVIETQDRRSAAARVLGRRWHHYKQPEHLFHFHRGTLRRALEHAGLEWLGATRRSAGKVISPAFVVERANRVSPALSYALTPITWLPVRGVYVNLFDEMIAFARHATD
jgi:SAM-dependent methyltransferase